MSGGGVVFWNGEEMAGRIEAAAWLGVINGISLIDQEATRLILATPKSGKTYRRRGVEHRASAPGEAPASDSGGLIGSKDIVLDRANVRASVVWRTAHALMLEIGTARMAARPFAAQAALNMARMVEDGIKIEIRKVLT